MHNERSSIAKIMSSDSVSMTPIGWVESVFKEKFGAPRQSGVVPSAEGVLRFHEPYDQADAFDKLGEFSHLWVISLFHLVPEKGFAPKVRPPKLGGEKKVGVFASRAPFRPNRLALTVVKLEEVIKKNGRICLRVSGLDLVDQSPILDVKPYLPYADSHPDALTGFGLQASSKIPVVAADEHTFSGLTPKQITLITETLAAQPQPAYAKERQFFGLTLGELNIRWYLENERIMVYEVEKND